MVKSSFVEAGTSLYYATKSGAFYTKPGWFWNGGKWYFLETGVTFARSTFVKSQGKTYYMDHDGTLMKNSFIYAESGIYYAVPGGVVRTEQGWRLIDGEWYYFYPGSGNMAINTYIGSYYVNNDGIWQH
jgi:glucan-binding YG repeat protein